MTDAQPTLFDTDSAGPEHELDRPNELQSPEALAGLLRLPGIGSARALRLARGFSTWDELLNATAEQVRNVAGRAVTIEPPAVQEKLPPSVRLVGYFDDDYPASLHAIPDPPAILWVMGSLPAHHAGLAVVGSRETTPWGASMAASVARDSVELGVSVISGLALGIDIAAHRSALAQSSGHTVAVLGSGVDVPTPREHILDAERILEAGGALVSEVPLGTLPSARTLVARNRLQSGLSAATLVVQCGRTSGTLHTARFTVQQGRRLLVPEPPASERDTDGHAGSQALVTKGISIGDRTTYAEVLRTRDDLRSVLSDIRDQ